MYRNIIFPVVSFGRETGSPILREEHQLRELENRAKRNEEVTGDWRGNSTMRILMSSRLLLIKFYSRNQSKKIELGWTSYIFVCVCVRGDGRRANRVLFGNERNRLFVRSRRRKKDTTPTYITEEWIGFIWLRTVASGGILLTR